MRFKINKTMKETVFEIKHRYSVEDWKTVLLFHLPSCAKPVALAAAKEACSSTARSVALFTVAEPRTDREWEATNRGKSEWPVPAATAVASSDRVKGKSASLVVLAARSTTWLIWQGDSPSGAMMKDLYFIYYYAGM
jgi:hypothetical protein